MKALWMVTIVSMFLAGAVGCQQDGNKKTTQEPDASSAKTDGGKYLLAAEPDDAQDVIEVREAAKDGDEVVVVGRIGGGENPWIDGRAAFTIVDGSLQACSDIPGDACEKPWDYCCETDKLPTSTALVKLVDEEEKLLTTDAKDLLNVKELSTVVVQGTAQRDDSGNLTILAHGVFVREL